MKIVKLALIFIAIVGVIVGIFFIDIDIDGITRPIGQITDIRLKELRAEIENGWKERTDWDKEFFVDYHKEIDVISRDFSVTTLRNFHTSQAVAIVHKKIFEHWSTAQCNKNNVDVYRNAVNIICNEDNDAKNNPTVNEIINVYNLYIKALGLATSNFVPKSGFNGSTWKSYDSYMREQKQAINSILGDTRYRSSLANITAIRNGLNGAEGRMASGKTKYYDNLVNEITTYYSGLERTNENLNKLFGINSTYCSEYRQSQKLQGFITNFANEVYANPTIN
ncbi:MAG: hypothetical protein J6U91_03760 [Alistipes sp.]|nr:hypothetical protein [Alistipes sp.]